MTSTDGLTHFNKVNIGRGIVEMPTRSFPAASLVIFTLLSSPLLAETINGKVVGVSDGDTITVLDATFQQYKIRLSGIDAPEKKTGIRPAVQGALKPIGVRSIGGC